jgi:hypothetical protein
MSQEADWGTTPGSWKAGRSVSSRGRTASHEVLTSPYLVSQAVRGPVFKGTGPLAS